MWGQKNKIRIGICLGRYLARRSTLMFIRGWGFSSSAWDLQRWRQLNTVSVSGSGSVGRTITSGTRGPWLDSSLGQILLIIFIYCVSVFKRLNWRKRCRARPTKTQIWAYYLSPMDEALTCLPDFHGLRPPMVAGLSAAWCRWQNGPWNKRN